MQSIDFLTYKLSRPGEEQRQLVQVENKLLKQQQFNTQQVLQKLREESQPKYHIVVDPTVHERYASFDKDEFLTQLFPKLMADRKRKMKELDDQNNNYNNNNS
jgi:hypothetical protein